MKKKWLNKGSAVLLAVAMVLSLFPGMKGTVATVQAAGNEEPSSGYWTNVNGLTGFNLSAQSTAIGKIKFGANGRLWAICGKDGEDLALLSTSAFEERVAYGATSEYSKSNFVKNIDNYLGTGYFSQGEIDKMEYVTVRTNEPGGPTGNHSVEVAHKKLYLPNAENQNSHRDEKIYVGSSNNIAVDIANKVKDINGFQENPFWLRSPSNISDNFALLAVPGIHVSSSTVNNEFAVVPAFNLNLLSVLFASAADAASSSYNGYKANIDMKENTYTLRYSSTGNESAVISGNGGSVAVTNANNKYLIVQNKAGMYAMRIDSDDKTVNARDIQMGSQEGDKLENFNNCKVWVESTTDRITTAKMAVTTINDVAVTDITAPAAGTALDIEAACAVAGVTNTAPTVTWTPNDTTAGYNTTYTASVTLTTEKNYEFAPDVAATVNGNKASAARNGDGTVTVTYEFPATAPTYTITAGAGGTRELSTDETLTITCDGALDKLTGIYVDGNLVDPANYTLKSGSTILTFKAAYLNTLSVGTHKVKLQYNDGSVETTIVIKEASAEDTTTQNTTTPSEKTEVPKTGDSTPAAWLFIVAIISGAGVVYFGKKKKAVR